MEGKRCKGRQRITYTKSLSEWMNVDEEEMIRFAGDRDIWKTMTVKAGNRQDTWKKKKKNCIKENKQPLTNTKLKYKYAAQFFLFYTVPFKSEYTFIPAAKS